MRVLRVIGVLSALTSAAILPGQVAGQSVTYHTTTSFHMNGALGALINHSGGSGSTVTTYVDGDRMRTDSRDNSTIIDADAGRFITVDNRQKTYMSMTFAEMADYMKQMTSSMQQAQQENAAKAKHAPASAGAPHDDIQLDYSVSAEKTGEHQTIAGYDAQRQFITMTMNAQDRSQPAGPDNGGSLVVLIDTWTSPDAPSVAAMRAFGRAYAAKAGKAFTQSGSGVFPLLNGNPQFKAALEAASKELEKVKGTQLRTTTYLVAVPQGMKLDRALVLGGGSGVPQQSAQNGAASGGKSGGGFFSRLKAAAQQASAQASSGQNASKTEEQATVFSVTNELQDLKLGVPAGAFAIPSGYRQLPPPVAPH